MIRRTDDVSPQALAAYDAIIDVRSPAEFAQDHLPGAINLPVLNDAERAEVGTEYVQGSKFLARRRGAALVARNIAAHLEGALADRGGGYKPLVHCWRGGQRSHAMAQSSIAPRRTSLFSPVRRDASRPNVSQVSAQSALRRMHWTSCGMRISARQASAQAMQAWAQVKASSMNRASAASGSRGAAGWAAIISLASIAYSNTVIVDTAAPKGARTGMIPLR